MDDHRVAEVVARHEHLARDLRVARRDREDDDALVDGRHTPREHLEATRQVIEVERRRLEGEDLGARPHQDLDGARAQIRAHLDQHALGQLPRARRQRHALVPQRAAVETIEEAHVLPAVAPAAKGGDAVAQKVVVRHAHGLRAMARQPERHAAAARVVRMDARDGRIVRAPCAPCASRRHGVDRAAKERLRLVAGY